MVYCQICDERLACRRIVVREVEILKCCQASTAYLLAMSRIETRNLFAKEIPCTFVGNGAIMVLNRQGGDKVGKYQH
jgi:hypothetical protein